MAVDNTSASGLAGRYAAALLELAEGKKELDKVASELADLKQTVAGSEDLTRLIRSPVYSRDEQSRAMAAILDKAGVGDLTRRFVLVVAQNRRLFALPQMIDAYLAELAHRRGALLRRLGHLPVVLLGMHEDAVQAALGVVECGCCRSHIPADQLSLQLLGWLQVCQ